jgi:hypothetical protein
MVGGILPAIYQALTAAGLTVYDEPPQQAAMPYVVMTLDTVRDWSTDGHLGIEAEVLITTWSSYRGSQEVVEMQDTVYHALHRAELQVAGAIWVGCDLEIATTLNRDGRTRYGTQRFIIYLDEVQT